MQVETKKAVPVLRGSDAEACASSGDGCARCNDSELFPDNAVVSGSAREGSKSTTKVMFLSVNDVYELVPDANGVGGLAELATMLKHIKQRIPRDTRVIVTLNGDFLWRSELDRKDKGTFMVDMLNEIGIEYVVLGNHEFDFGAEHLYNVLADANFISFGSNVRSTSDGQLYPGLVDVCIVPLSNGLRLGLFGVVTTDTGKDPFAGSSVVFDDEIPHARRCVEKLKEQGANAIVALTHFKVTDDVRLAMQVPGINLILGGHDHFPVTCGAGVDTLIHKSGMDALWVGIVEMTLTAPILSQRVVGEAVAVEMRFQWKMQLNRGYQPDPTCRAILDKYIHDVEREESAEGKLEPLSTAVTALDGRRTTCRTQESNMGNLVADALREGLRTDVGLINAGYIKGDKLNDPGLVITKKWLEKYLPLVKPTVVVELSMDALKDALTYWLRRFPAMSSSQPHFSGIRVVYDITQTMKPVITSIRLSKELYEDPVDVRDDIDEPEISMDRIITVALPLVANLDGWQFFGDARQIRSGPLVRDLVEEFVRQRTEVDYPPKEGRLRISESPQPSIHHASL